MEPQVVLAGRAVEELVAPCDADVDPCTGSAVVTVPIPLSAGRSGFSPSLSFAYNSGAGNSAFGHGWNLAGVAPILISTADGLPGYDGHDRFASPAGDDLVPSLVQTGGIWDPRTEEHGAFVVRMFRSRTDRARIRFEQWIEIETGRVHWRSRDAGDVVTVYGRDASGLGRIADPADPERRTFGWLPEAQYDPSGNALRFVYVAETADDLDPASTYEHGLRAPSGFAQRYLKRILYGNTEPLGADAADPAGLEWLYEVVLDYGDHSAAIAPAAAPDLAWPARPDAFSTFRPGFEVRTYRLCRRVLMFHRFRELGPGETLVWSVALQHTLDPAGSTLVAIGHTGFRRAAAGAAAPARRALPPLSFGYSVPEPDDVFRAPAGEGPENVPQGLTGRSHQWTDLYGEGLPGILLETGSAWYYNRNQGGGRFGPQQPVPVRPVHPAAGRVLTDFDRDGNTDAVVLQGRDAGYYTLDRDSETWEAFRPFESLPHLEAAAARVQWVDVDGDGRPDLVISHPDRFTWYPSRASEGFAPAVEIPKPQSPAMVQAQRVAEDVDLDFFFADMNGDGLVDLVRAENGRVEYWPQIGRGRFGDGVLMEGSPRFDEDEQFDPRRLHFADLDGTGTADVLYVGRGAIRRFTNASGNRLVEAEPIRTPYIDNLASIRVLDFLGDGTACLVWSSGLPGVPSSIRFLRLSGGVPPRLLLTVDNGMGQEVRLSYASSAAHYLRDVRSGRGWRSRLSSHTVVVDRREVVDQVRDVRAVSRFEYHDGRFDGTRRAFLGFALVDRYDAETHARVPTVPGAPSCTRTWFHPGTSPWEVPGRDGYAGDARAPALAADEFEDLAALTHEEFADGVRAVAGEVIREEVYAVEPSGARAAHPFSVTQGTYRLRRLQPSRDGHPASFDFYVQEQLTADYEQLPDDPRQVHELVLAVDPHGNPTVEVAVAYARRARSGSDPPAQDTPSFKVLMTTFANLDGADRHELGIPVERREFEVAGFAPDAGAVFSAGTLAESLRPALQAPLGHHEPFSSGVQARLCGWQRTYYWDTPGGTALAIGSVGTPTLAHHEESACFATAFVSQAFAGRVDAAMLTSDGRYFERDGYWWRADATSHFAGATGFHQVNEVIRADGARTTFAYDPYDITVVEIRDALQNRTQASIDYHLVAAAAVTDPNGNVTEVRCDPLGVAVVTTRHGQLLSPSGPQPYGHDALSAYVAQPDETIAAVLADPSRFVQRAERFVAYDLALGADGDAVDREFLKNPSFDDSSATGPTRLEGTFTGGPSAAAGWRVWNNADVLTTTEQLPTTRPAGSGAMVHVTTGGDRCGLFQRFLDANSGPARVRSSAWVFVLRGAVQLGTGSGDNTVGDTVSSGTGRWELLSAPNALSPAYESIIYSRSPDGAEFYVDEAAVRIDREFLHNPDDSMPLGTVTVEREELVHDGRGGGAAGGPKRVTIGYRDGFGRALQDKVRVEPGLAVQRGADGRIVVDAAGVPVLAMAAERWLVSGHVSYDARQQPDEEFEPFFSTTPVFESDAELRRFGVSFRRSYDAVGRLVEEHLPNGTNTRTVHLPWRLELSDPNDTVQDSRYRLERELLADTEPEKRALRKAQAHAQTPTIVHLDPEGREIRTVQTGASGEQRTMDRALDCHGMPVTLTDARRLPAFTYALDLQGRILRTDSVDAGTSRVLYDAVDRPVHAWDARGVHHQREFDGLDRVTSLRVDGALGLNQRVEEFRYGEDPAVTQAALRNLRGRLERQRDAAGVRTVELCDPDGQVLRAARQLRGDYTTEPDWAGPPVTLEPEVFVSERELDALGRIRREMLPDGSDRRINHRSAGGITRIRMSTSDGMLTDREILRSARFDARGQRDQATLGNNVEIVHEFDPETARTRRITARRSNGSAPAVMDLSYTYDPVGNVTHTADAAQEPAAATPLLQGLTVTSAQDFTYDAYYQLRRAEGRVHQALLEHDYRPNLPHPGGRKGTRHLTLNNAAAIERYAQTYAYDLAGNLEQIRHQGPTQSWTTDFWISPTSNRSLPARDPAGNTIPNPESGFDPSGNCQLLAHLRRLQWGHPGSPSRAVIIERPGAIDDAEYYVYDADGQRVRKVLETLVATGTEVTEKIYLDGCEIKRIRRGATVLLERITSHIADDLGRVALVHRWTVDSNARETDDVTQPRFHYQLTNHLGSTVLDLDSSGAVIGYEEYFPYGAAAFIAGDNLRDVERRDYRYGAKERDDATGLYYFGYRYYAPWIGRWLSPDPIGPEDGLNLYVYALGNPVSLYDPDGLQAQVPQRYRSRIEAWSAEEQQEFTSQAAGAARLLAGSDFSTFVPEPGRTERTWSASAGGATLYWKETYDAQGNVQSVEVGKSMSGPVGNEWSIAAPALPTPPRGGAAPPPLVGSIEQGWRVQPPTEDPPAAQGETQAPGETIATPDQKPEDPEGVPVTGTAPAVEEHGVPSDDPPERPLVGSIEQGWTVQPAESPSPEGLPEIDVAPDDGLYEGQQPPEDLAGQRTLGDEFLAGFGEAVLEGLRDAALGMVEQLYRASNPIAQLEQAADIVSGLESVYRQEGSGLLGVLGVANSFNPASTMMRGFADAQAEAGQALYLREVGDPEGAREHAQASGRAAVRYMGGAIELGIVGGVAAMRAGPKGASGRSARAGEWHHIATRYGGWAAEYGPMFEKAGLTLESAENFLKLIDHSGPHPPQYHLWVKMELEAATKGLSRARYQAAFVKRLGEIGGQLTKEPGMVAPSGKWWGGR